MMKDDKFFWFKENRIVIPGVKGEHVFMHLTDSHIDVVDELSTPEERESTTTSMNFGQSIKRSLRIRIMNHTENRR